MMRKLAALAVVFSATAASAAGRDVALSDSFRIEELSGTAISPDGRWVAFVRTHAVRDEDRRHSEVWLVPSDGSAPPRRVGDPALRATDPVWSPDGTLLAYRAARVDAESAESGGAASIWFLRMDAPAGEPFRIEGVEGAEGKPLFSFDNRWIAFRKKTPPATVAARAYSSELERELAERFKGRIYDWMGFRFDGRGYLPDPRDPSASPPEELYLVPRGGGQPRQLTQLGVDVQSAAWSPDGRRLVIAADAHQRDEYVYERADLWTVDLEGRTRRLTNDGYHHSAPVWSPDGTEIAFRRAKGLTLVIEAGESRGAPLDLFVMPAHGGALRNLTAPWELRPGEPVWAGDGYLYFDAAVGGNHQLFRTAASGGAVGLVTRGDRRLRSFDIAAGRMAYVASDATHPAEIFAASLDGAGETRLSGFHDALVEEVSFRPAERILYASEDGTEIEGWVILPRGYGEPGRVYPMILSIHGGPHGAYGNELSFPFQLLAANGYVVLYTNPRGSTGYGEDFLYATWGGWGTLDTQDVLAGVDHAARRYAVDPARLGVTGYSYGGFLTNWIVGHTNRFAAAVVGAGISNWVSDYGTADIPRTKESEFYGPPWEERSGELLWKLSPVRYAGNVVTPTLFIHGESDFRVPIEQGEQMYTALKKRRVPARFVRYPGTYHGGWKPWNVVHRYHQELLWWKEHLPVGSGASEPTGPSSRAVRPAPPPRIR